MASNFLQDDNGVSTFISEVKGYLQEYKNSITSLEQLVNNMSSSSAWKDEDVKTSFVNTAKSYIEGFKSFSTGLEGYVECLKTKTDNVKEHESNFS